VGVANCLYGLGACFSSCGESDLDPLAFILHIHCLNKFWISAKLVCSFCEAMAGSLSVASTSGSSAKVAMVDSGEIGRFVVFSRYSSGLGHCLEVCLD
jgi:hypothetical protein